MYVLMVESRSSISQHSCEITVAPDRISAVHTHDMKQYINLCNNSKMVVNVITRLQLLMMICIYVDTYDLYGK